MSTNPEQFETERFDKLLNKYLDRDNENRFGGDVRYFFYGWARNHFTTLFESHKEFSLRACLSLLFSEHNYFRQYHRNNSTAMSKSSLLGAGFLASRLEAVEMQSTVLLVQHRIPNVVEYVLSAVGPIKGKDEVTETELVTVLQELYPQYAANL